MFNVLEMCLLSGKAGHRVTFLNGANRLKAQASFNEKLSRKNLLQIWFKSNCFREQKGQMNNFIPICNCFSPSGV